MQSTPEVRAIPGKGLVGDRYFSGDGTFSPHPQKPDYEITFIEREKVEAFARDSGLAFTASHARRNIGFVNPAIIWPKVPFQKP